MTVKQTKVDIKRMKADLDFVRKCIIFAIQGGNQPVFSFF